MGERFEPFVGLSGEYDIVAVDSTFGDDDCGGGLVNVGSRYYGDHGITAGAQYSTLLWRGDLSEHSLNLVVHMDFD